LQAVGLPVPEGILNATAHLAEFGGKIGQEESDRVAAILDGLHPGATEGKAFRAIPAEEYHEEVKKAEAQAPKTTENAVPLPSVEPKEPVTATDPKPKEKPTEAVQEGTPPPNLGEIRRKTENTTYDAKSPGSYRSTQDELRKAMEAASSSFNMRRRHPLHKKV
jgi:hypothetical protein